MSIQNHPNFHACKFVVDIMSSYYKCLRNETAKKYDPCIRDELLKFVETIENKVDHSVNSNTKAEESSA